MSLHYTATPLRSVPAILISTGAVLVDKALPLDRYNDRISATVGLWVAVSLQGPDVSSSTVWFWVHTTFATLVVRITMDRFDHGRFARGQQQQQERRCGRWFGSVPVSSLGTTYVASFVLADRLQGNTECVAVFVTLFVLLMCYQWWQDLSRRRAKQEDELVGIPLARRQGGGGLLSTTMTTRTTGTTTDRYGYVSGGTQDTAEDESNWERWNPSQVLIWIARQEEEWIPTVCEPIATECLSGVLLASLSVTDLRSMGVPYGPARLVVARIRERLLRRYPPRQVSMETTMTEGGYDAHVDPYGWSMPSMSSQPQPQPQQYGGINPGSLQQSASPGIDAFGTSTMMSPPKPTPGDLPELDGSIQQRAEALMQDRFGLHLPEIKGGTERMDFGNDSRKPASTGGVAHQPVREGNESTKLKTTATTPTPTPTTTIPGGIPSLVWDKMPQHIREIALNKPELVMELLNQRASQRTAKSSSNPSHLSGSRLETVGEDSDASDDESEEAGQAGSEMMGLLRKRHR